MTHCYEYSYIETGSIRLLTVISTSPQVRLRVEAVPLNLHPVYNALSYQWGDDKPFQRITVDDGYIDIAENLSMFLCHMGEFAGERIWIDALCINQQDNEEKSRQISQMTAVYEQASKVLMWLGPTAEESDWALDGIGRYGKAAFDAGLLNLERRYFEAWPDVGDDPGRIQTREKVQALLATASEAEADPGKAADRFPRVAFAALTQRKYFNRVWVKQEVTLARNAVIICGDASTEADFFHATIMLYGLLTLWEAEEFRTGRQTRPPGPFSIEELMAAPTPWDLLKKTMANPSVSPLFAGRWKYQRSQETKQPLRELLHTSYVRSGAVGLQSTEPQDKIYGLLGIVSDANDLGIVVDCNKSAEQVYEDVTRALILKQGHIDMLKWCRSRRGNPPTWVPDFSNDIAYTWTDEVGTPLFKATGTRKQPEQVPEDEPAIDVSTDVSGIRLQGFILDTVAEVGVPFTHDSSKSFDQRAAVSLFLELERYLETKSSYPKESFEDALWRIPICDKELHPTSAYYQRATDHSKKQFVLLATQILTDEVIGMTMSYQAVMQYQDGARLIVTEGGYVGMGPKEATPGDVVSLLFGGSAPFVLRPAEAGRYKLVGESYVYGVMDGEAMETGLKEMVFELW